MANPQKENGYTAISNEILDHLIQIKINSDALKIVLFIIRKTYGFNKKQDKISLSQFVLATQLKKSVICRGLNRLNNMNIIIRIANDDCTIYRFNKDFDTWKPLAKLLTLAKQQTSVSYLANASLAKQRHTKDNTTKDTNTKDMRVELKSKNNTPLGDLVTGDEYTPDGKNPLYTLKEKRKLERCLGIKKANRWASFVFGVGWDFLTAYESAYKRKYFGNVILDEVAKNLAGWFERGETRETIREMIIVFLESEKKERVGMSPTTVFSVDTYNKWKNGELKPKKKHKEFL
jgi:phage replication O-like protein O